MRKVVVALLLGAAGLSACGEGGTDAGQEPREEAASPGAGEEASIEQVVDGYFNAPDAGAVCDHITLGFQEFLADGFVSDNEAALSPADEGCEEVVDAAAERGDFFFETVDVEIQRTLVDGDRAAVRIVHPSHPTEPYAVYLTKTESGWLMASEHEVPSGFGDLASEIRRD